MHPVGKNVRNVCFEFEIESDHYGVPDRFVPEQNRHFLNDVVDVHHRTFRGCAFFVERPQTVDNINCAARALSKWGDRVGKPHKHALALVIEAAWAA